MGKSKHPPLLSKALDHLSSFNADREKDTVILGTYSSAAQASARAADAAARDAKNIYLKMRHILDAYARKVLEIEKLEAELANAKGDKAKTAEIGKKLKLLEKAADKLRADYKGQGASMISTFKAAIGAIDATYATTKKLSSW